MLNESNFIFGFYKRSSKDNNMTKVEDKENLSESELVFGIRDNFIFKDKIPLLHGNIYYIKEKNEFLVFHFKINNINNNILGYGFSFFEKYYANSYDFDKIQNDYKNCTFEFIGNIFIHKMYLFDIYSKKINLASIYYQLNFTNNSKNLKITFNSNSVIYFSLKKEKVELEKEILFKSLYYPGSLINLKIEKEISFINHTESEKIIYKEKVQGYDGTIFYPTENSFKIDEEMKKAIFILFLEKGEVRITNSNNKELYDIPLPFMEENWLEVGIDNPNYKDKFLNLIS